MFIQVTLQLLQGFGVTCLIFFATLVCSLPIGLILSFGSMSRFKPLKYVVKTFVWIIRGTPLILQIFVLYFFPSKLMPWWTLSEIPTVIVAFVINYSCYFSEIYRGGIESINKGQYEAAQVLGLTKTQIFFKVVLLQVVKRIIPPMSNEVMTLVKDTSLARVIAVDEILKVAYDFASGAYSNIGAIIWPLFYTAVYYLAFIGILTLVFGFVERKLGYFKV